MPSHHPVQTDKIYMCLTSTQSNIIAVPINGVCVLHFIWHIEIEPMKDYIFAQDTDLSKIHLKCIHMMEFFILLAFLIGIVCMIQHV